MKRMLPAVAAAFLLASAACTGSGTGEDPEQSGGADPTAAATSAPPVYTAAELPAITPPDGFALIDGGASPFLLPYEPVAAAYGLGGSASDVIYLTAYLIPEDRVPENHEQMVPFVREYDELSANEIENDVTTHALIHHREGIFRFAEVRDSKDAKLYQRNFFVFEGRMMYQVSCQWQAESAAVKTGCSQILQQIDFPQATDA